MELHALDGELFVGDGHKDAVPAVGQGREAGGQGIGIHH